MPDRKRRELETMAAGLKAVASRHATDTIQACREACGGAGYLRSNRFAALKADTDVFTTFEGDNTVLLQLAAKNLLTDYRDQFGELDPLGVATFIAGQVLGTIAERTAGRRVLGGGDLLDREEQLGLLRFRQEHILEGVARRLKRGIDGGRAPFDVLVDCQDHVVAAAGAWVDLVVLEAFADGVERCADPRLRALLDRLCSLYALSRVEAERGWYQEHGRLTAARSKAVIKAVNALCAELRPDAGLLVAGFGVPVPAARRRPRRAALASRGMSRLPRAERERQTLDAARTLFAARGFAAVTMDEVAAVVGVTKPLLYAYFGNKERLYLACMEPAGEALVATVAAGRARHRDARGGAAGRACTRSSPSSIATAARGGCCSTRRCPPARSRRGGRRRSATG